MGLVMDQEVLMADATGCERPTGVSVHLQADEPNQTNNQSTCPGYKGGTQTASKGEQTPPRFYSPDLSSGYFQVGLVSETPGEMDQAVLLPSGIYLCHSRMPSSIRQVQTFHVVCETKVKQALHMQGLPAGWL